jgi:hypothetical protein
MRGFLLDTNIVSELRRPAPDFLVEGFVAAQPEEFLFLSEIVFAEIRYGIERLDDPARRVQLSDWLDNNLRPLFAGRALPVSEDVVLRWRLLLDAGRRRGHTFGQPDLFIAATGALHDLVCVTRDIDHFVAAGVATLDPWTGRFFAGGEFVRTLERLDDSALIERLAAES